MSDPRLESPICYTCGATTSPFWKRHKVTGNILCSGCYKTDKNNSLLNRTPSPLTNPASAGSIVRNFSTSPHVVKDQRESGAGQPNRAHTPTASPQPKQQQQQHQQTRTLRLFPRDLSSDFVVATDVSESVLNSKSDGSATATTTPSPSEGDNAPLSYPGLSSKPTPRSSVADSFQFVHSASPIARSASPIPFQFSTPASTTTPSSANVAEKTTDSDNSSSKQKLVCSSNDALTENKREITDSAETTVGASGSSSGVSSKSAVALPFTDSPSQSRPNTKPPSDKLEIQVLKSVETGPIAKKNLPASSSAGTTKRIDRKCPPPTRATLVPAAPDSDPPAPVIQDNIFKRVAARELAREAAKGAKEDEKDEDYHPRKNPRAKTLKEKRTKSAAASAAAAAVASARKSTAAAATAAGTKKAVLARKSVSPLKSKANLIRQKSRALKARAAITFAAEDEGTLEAEVSDESRRKTSRRDKLKRKRENLILNRKNRGNELSMPKSASTVTDDGAADGNRMDKSPGNAGLRASAKSMPIARKRNLQTRKRVSLASQSSTTTIMTTTTVKDDGDEVKEVKRRKIHSAKAKEATEMTAKVKPKSALGKVVKPAAASKKSDKEEKKPSSTTTTTTTTTTTSTTGKEAKPTTSQSTGATSVLRSAAQATPDVATEDAAADAYKNDKGSDELRKARADARSAATVPPKRKPANGKGTKSKVGRRNLFFKQRGSVVRGTTRVASIISPDVIYFRGQFWQKGDIVSVVDDDDDQVYYAQIRGFIQDQYCEKGAVLTWLLPTLHPGFDRRTQLHPGFHPHAFVSGPEEDLPRKMECLDFVCRAPSDYFKLPAGTGGLAPFPVAGAEEDEPGLFEAQRRKLGFVWVTSSRDDGEEEEETPTIQPVPSMAQMLLGNDGDEDCY